MKHIFKNKVIFSIIFLFAVGAVFFTVQNYFKTEEARAAGLVTWHPGQYCRFNAGDPVKNIELFLANPYTKGIAIEINWEDFETTKNNYNAGLATVNTYLNLVALYNKYLTVMIKESCFNGCTDAISPAYLRTDSTYNGGVALMYDSQGEVKGSCIRRWDPIVVDRFIAAYAALGAEYDNHPNLAGVLTYGESAIAIHKSDEAGYSDANYLAQYKRLMAGVSSAFPTTPVFAGINFIGGGETALRSLADHLVTLPNAGFTHPDTAPPRTDYYHYDIEEDYKSQIGIAPMVQTNQVEPTDLSSVYTFSINKLGAHYILWNKADYNSGGSWGNSEYYITNAVLPVVNFTHGYTIQTCPTSFTGGCNTGGAPTPTPVPACHTYTNTSSVPAGFGASWNTLTSAKEMLMKANCADTSTAFEIGNGNQITYIYKNGYVYKDNKWNPITYTGTPVTGSDVWLKGTANYTLSNSSTSGYFAAYVCQYINSVWKCGCRDSACVTPYWQLQKWGR